MAIHYETNCGQFVMYRDGKPVMRPLDEVALAVGSDGDGGLLLHKHGEPTSVRAWVAKMKLGGGELASDLIVHQGAFDLHELNQAIGGNTAALCRLVGDSNVIDLEVRVVDEGPSGP